MISSTAFDKFGLTEEELQEALKYYKIETSYEEAEKWYNGYKINNTKLYNPFSIIDFLRERGRVALYWLNSSSNEFIIKLIRENFNKSKEKLILLGEGESIEVTISDNIIFRDLKDNEESLWSILFYSGYLKADKILDPILGKALVSIPNQEILMCYKIVFGSLFTTNAFLVPRILEALLKEDYLLFHESLYEALLKTTSTFDITLKEGENFYHALFLGLILHLREGEYFIKSNKESGLGRADLIILPHDQEKTGFILEFKKARSPSLLLEKAQEGLLQIQEKEYISLFEEHKIKKVSFLSIAFCGKNFYLLTHEEWVNESLKEYNEKSNSYVVKKVKKVKKSLKLTEKEKIALNFLRQGVSLDIVVLSTGISLERLEELKMRNF
jgi:hypothetical protein